MSTLVVAAESKVATAAKNTVTIAAPCRGWVSGLAQVPDPVFATRLMGNGIAIEPLDGSIRAPCDGIVIALAPTLHSVTLALANGAELLIHIGIDTVALRGRGFIAQVAQGARVAAGDVLIEVDLDLVMRAGKSLVSPIIVLNEGYRIEQALADRGVACGDAMFSISGAIADDGPSRIDLDSGATRCDVTIGLAHGIHARPAARIVAAIKGLHADVDLIVNGRTANARSMVAMLALGARHGDRASVIGVGRDGSGAVAAIVMAIEADDQEVVHSGPVVVRTREVVPDGTIAGVTAASGFAFGPAFRFRPLSACVDEDADDPVAERAALERALLAIDAELAVEADAIGGTIAAAHRGLLDDPDLLATAASAITAGRTAASAWRAAINAATVTLRATGDPRMIERVADLTDIEQRVVARLVGAAAPPPPPPPGSILIADELLPSQFMALRDAGLAGICSAGGGPTSHVAILAGAAGLPMLVATGAAVFEIVDGSIIILDADAGRLCIDPDDRMLAEARARLDHGRVQRTIDLAGTAADCHTADGTRIEIFANLGSLDDAHAAVVAGAEGCGLLRTEFLFLERSEAPSEAEQRETYAAIAVALGDRPLIVRTLDIGGDKPVSYLPSVAEDNPALGARGIRLGLAHPDLLAMQLRAIVAGVPPAQCRIMLPMIVDRDEFRAVRLMLDEARAAVGCAASIPLGVMIETPAAALLAHSLAADADFLSIGTNDLTQYTLAADRGNPALAYRIDALHPAVLQLIALARSGASAHGRWLGVCGSLASDPRAAALLVGLGVTELSATPAAIPAIKAVIRTLHRDQCRALAAQALALGTAREVRALLAIG